ncbi:MAG: hypothetical protein IMF19_14220 [Proteobacteria bacterium]|nr:hypothetical protein [Pseudomonadota bacterium]
MKHGGGIVDIGAWREVSTVTLTGRRGAWVGQNLSVKLQSWKTWDMQKKLKEKRLSFLLYCRVPACAGLVSASAAILPAFPRSIFEAVAAF